MTAPDPGAVAQAAEARRILAEFHDGDWTARELRQWAHSLAAVLDVVVAALAPPAPTEDTARRGDPDPTPDEGPYCGAALAGACCTRSPGHPGQHVAGDSHRVVMVWDGQS